MATENDTTTTAEHHAIAEQIANESHYLERMAVRDVPEHLRGGLMRYLVHRIPPGHFLIAVLSNDLRGAIDRGDETSLMGLANIIRFLVNDVTYTAWGSEVVVRAWVEGGRR